MCLIFMNRTACDSKKKKKRKYFSKVLRQMLLSFGCVHPVFHRRQSRIDILNILKSHIRTVLNY